MELDQRLKETCLWCGLRQITSDGGFLEVANEELVQMVVNERYRDVSCWTRKHQTKHLYKAEGCFDWKPKDVLRNSSSSDVNGTLDSDPQVR